ncbi:MAG TPA: glycerol-3-phosphate 1-O-acyltransferase PlsY [Gammaproteobacteria bacterium]|nr:glycerol-3-phosphate 1-O-acyltransferase PlsY [Gammaproteobacteria bacterium]
MQYEIWVLTLIAYLFGSISSAIITCKLLGLPDPRTEGSGNPGTTNVLRIGGKKAAIITLIGDCLKGVIPVLLAKWFDIDTLGLALVAFAAFFGHLYPIFFKFQGGKGVATAFGCMTALSWPVGVCLLVTWLTIALMFRYSSLAALVTAITAPLFTYFFTNVTFTIMAVIMSLLLVFRHSKNIRNLFAGKESKIGKK